MLHYIAAAATIIGVVLVAGVGLTTMSEISDNYTCENLDGYNPSGKTAAEKYPPDTWAGLCEKNKSGAVMLRGLLVVIGALVIGITGIVIMQRLGWPI